MVEEGRMNKLLSTAPLLLLGMLPAAALDTPLHKKVAVHYQNSPLAEVLKHLGQKAGVRFECDPALLEGWGPVNLKVGDQEAGRVATRILHPRGLGLTDRKSVV